MPSYVDYVEWVHKYKHLKGERFVNQLIKDLNIRDVEARRLAAYALSNLAEVHYSWGSTYYKSAWEDFEMSLDELNRTVAPLTKALRDKDDIVCNSVVRALGFIGDFSTVKPLIEILRTGSIAVRARAAWALGKVGDDRAIEPLIDALYGGDSEVKSWAAWALGALGSSNAVPYLISALRSPQREVVRLSLSALSRLGDIRALEPVIELLGDPHTPSSVFEDAISVLDALGDRRAVMPLLELLLRKGHDAQYSAARALGKLGDRRIVPQLLEALATGSAVRRRAVIHTLGQLRSGDAIEPLLKLVGSDIAKTDISTTDEALRALGDIGDSRAFETLIGFLGHLNAKLHFAAISALGRLGDKRALGPLVSMLSATESPTRYEAIDALGDLGDPGAIQFIINRLLADVSVDVRWNAARVLGEIGDEHVLDPLRHAVEHDEGRTYESIDSIADIAAEAIGMILSRQRDNRNSET